jgi:hypothetical protein
MTKEILCRAGWVAVAEGLLGIPLFIISIYSSAIAGPRDGAHLMLFVSLLSLAFYIYLFNAFKKLLNEEFDFHEADLFIDWMIKINVLSFVVTAFTSGSNQTHPGVLTVNSAMLVIIGITGILFSIRLLRLPHSLYGLRKPYGLLFLVGSMACTTVVLFPVSIVLGACCSLMQALIFFRSAEHLAHTVAIAGNQQRAFR